MIRKGKARKIRRKRAGEKRRRGRGRQSLQTSERIEKNEREGRACANATADEGGGGRASIPA